MLSIPKNQAMITAIMSIMDSVQKLSILTLNIPGLLNAILLEDFQIQQVIKQICSKYLNLIRTSCVTVLTLICRISSCR